MKDLFCGIKFGHGLFHGGRFALARGRAGVGDDGAVPCEHGGVLHKAAVRVGLVRRQNRYIHAAFFKRFNVGPVLFKRLFINRDPQLGMIGDAVDHGGAGRFYNDMLKHFTAPSRSVSRSGARAPSAAGRTDG